MNNRKTIMKQCRNRAVWALEVFNWGMCRVERAYRCEDCAREGSRRGVWQCQPRHLIAPELFRRCAEMFAVPVNSPFKFQPRARTIWTQDGAISWTPLERGTRPEMLTMLRVAIDAAYLTGLEAEQGFPHQFQRLQRPAPSGGSGGVLECGGGTMLPRCYSCGDPASAPDALECDPCAEAWNAVDAVSAAEQDARAHYLEAVSA